MAASKSKRKDPMDGAYFTYMRENTPADFMNGPDGLRPGEQNKPSGSIRLDLKYGVKGKTLPTRTIWREGHWKETDSNKDDWDVWVTSGEGMPGNYEFREYILPESKTKEVKPKHPADWSKKDQEGWDDEWKSTGSWKSQSSSSKSSSSDLPFGLRVRCPGCGHFYSMADLPGHTKSACPASQPQPAMWVIECECHPKDLQTAATILPGFPVKPVAPDMSGDDGKKDGKAEAKTEKKEPVKA